PSSCAPHARVTSPTTRPRTRSPVPPAGCATGSKTTSRSCSSTRPRRSERSPAVRRPVPALAALALLAGAAPHVLAGPARDLRLAPATPGAVRFTVMVPSPRFTAAARDSSTQNLAVDGYTPGGADDGATALPGRVLLVAVPPAGDVRLTAAASEAV